MTYTVIIIFCILLLLAYLFDITSSKSKIPSVILLLFLGWIVKQAAIYLGIQLPDFSVSLPILGTLGLILIVLEGSLELDINKSKIKVVRKSFVGALLSLLAAAFIFSLLFLSHNQYSLRDALINAIPFCVISSAIAIPSSRSLTPQKREFITYESSFSDILGVLFFTFMTLNGTFGFVAIGTFGLQIIIMVAISFVSTIILAFLLSKIQHHIKFIPIILLLFLIYAVSEIYHLPALIFILLFGLLVGNHQKFTRYTWFERFKPEILTLEVVKFKELAIEAAFLVRALFFLLFGYMLETSEVLNQDTILWAMGIVAIIFTIRFIQLKLSKLSLKPLLYIAPRGLITILLFLSIAPSQSIDIVNKSLIVQVVVISALIMMIGIMTRSNDSKKTDLKEHQNDGTL